MIHLQILGIAILILLILKFIILYKLKSSEFNQKGYFNVMGHFDIKELSKKVDISKYSGKDLYLAKICNHYTNVIYVLGILLIISIFLSD